MCGREAIFITTLVFWILKKEVYIQHFFLDLLRYLSKKLKMYSKSHRVSNSNFGMCISVFICNSKAVQISAKDRNLKT